MQVTKLALFNSVKNLNAISLAKNEEFLAERRKLEQQYMAEINNLRQQILNEEHQFFEFINQEKIDRLQEQINKIVTQMQWVDQDVCLSNAMYLKNYTHPTLGWKCFAPWKQSTDDENVGAFSFQCMNISSRLMKFLHAFSRGCSSNYIEKHLNFFIPEAILTTTVKSSLVESINNPRANQKQKNCRRFLTAYKVQEKYTEKYGFNFYSTRAMIVEFIKHVANGDKFATGDEFFDAIGNKSIQNSQVIAKTLLERANFDVVKFLQDNFEYKETNFITNNAKGCISRPCKMSSLQKTIISAFLCNENQQQKAA